MLKSLSCVWLFVTPWTVAGQAPLSMGIPQARILEWVVIPFSRGSSWPRDWILVSCIASRFFIIWATREAPQDSSIAGTDLPTKNDHLNLLLTRINSLVTAFADLQHTLKGVQCGFSVETQKAALCALGKTNRTGFQIDSFRRFYEPTSCISSYLEKH